MNQIIPHVHSETGRLRTVVLGLPDSPGRVPTLSETYDAKSYESVKRGIYPTDIAIRHEMNAFLDILQRYGVEVLRPLPLDDYNQIFARDVAFTIDDKLFRANMIEDRARETKAFQPIWDRIPQDRMIHIPEKINTEGGDVIVHGDYIFLGTTKLGTFDLYKTARTNRYAADYFKEIFPHKQIIKVQLKKDDKDPYQSVLHLDCAFQPVGNKYAILYPSGLERKEDYHRIIEIFGKDNIFEITNEEAYWMYPNVFSISPSVVVIEENFHRLGAWLRERSIQVETVPYREISKMGGLLRCSTMPLVRQD